MLILKRYFEGVISIFAKDDNSLHKGLYLWVCLCVYMHVCKVDLSTSIHYVIVQRNAHE